MISSRTTGSFRAAFQNQDIYSVRVGLGYRALGLLEGSLVTWFWIGSHADYDRLV